MTRKDGRRRYLWHVQGAERGRTYCAKWIRSLMRAGGNPIYLTIERGTGDNWQERERFWIAAHRKFCNLTNLTDGGEGACGYKHGPAALAKMRGRVVSAETRAKLSESHKGQVVSAKARELLSIRSRGNKHRLGKKASEETLRKKSIALKGRPRPDWVRKKISEGHKKRWAKIAAED